MKKSLKNLLFLVPLGLIASCMRELQGASCPCVAGWSCCEEQNICRPEGDACDAHERQSDEPPPEYGGVEVADAAVSSDAPDAVVRSRPRCTAAREPDTLVCPGAPFGFARADNQETSIALVGRWQLCASDGFGDGAPPAGFEFTHDGYYYLLGFDRDDALTHVANYPRDKYNVGTVDSDQKVYVNLAYSVAGAEKVATSFDSTRAHMRVNFAPERSGDYVRIPDGVSNAPGVLVAGACTEPSRVDADSSGSSVCDLPGPALMCPGGSFSSAQLDSPAAVAPALIGRWQACQGRGFTFSPKQAHSGVEFTSDGKYFLLGVDARGALRRVEALRSSGTYEVLTGVGFPEDGDVKFSFSEGGTASFSPAFDVTKTRLFAAGNSGLGTSYVKVPDGADNVVGVVVENYCVPPPDAGVDGPTLCERRALQERCPSNPYLYAPLNTLSETQQALLGRWQLCEGGGFPRWPSASLQGVEFTSDGEVFWLEPDTQGALRRLANDQPDAVYQTLVKYPLDLSIIMRLPDGGSVQFDPRFDESQSHLSTLNTGVPSTWVHIPDGEASVPDVVSPGSCI